MQIIAIANHKGGVGKTVTTHALGVVLSSDRRVLLVDTDPQSSLTVACGVSSAADRSLAEVLGGAVPGPLTVGEVIRPLSERLHLAPADIALANSELGLISRRGREGVLRRALAAVEGAYDLCLIDCPPSLGLLTVNALTAADGVLIPVVPEEMSLRGLTLFLGSVRQVKEELNPRLSVLGVVATMVIPRLIHHQEALDLLARRVPLLETRIGRSVRVAEAAGSGQSIVTYEPTNSRATEYRALAQEVARWLSDAGH